MGATKWTPGPWEASNTEHGIQRSLEDSVIVAVGTGFVVARTSMRHKGGAEDANAHLIAASPDLAAALEALVNLIDSSHIVRGHADVEDEQSLDAYTKARAALARARGDS